MNKTGFVAATAGLMLIAGSAFAAFADIDLDGDGAVSAEEFANGFPDMTADTFTAIDTNADGSVTEDEYTVAVEAGLLPAD